jgi:mono/diheme cytochrome c family protein
MTIRLMTVGLVLLASVTAAYAAVEQSDPKKLYDDNCMTCHGVRGLPPKAMKSAFPKIPAFDAAFIASRTDDSIVKILTRGKSDVMLSFKGKLTPEQMGIVAKYVRSLASK